MSSNLQSDFAQTNLKKFIFHLVWSWTIQLNLLLFLSCRNYSETLCTPCTVNMTRSVKWNFWGSVLYISLHCTEHIFRPITYNVTTNLWCSYYVYQVTAWYHVSLHKALNYNVFENLQCHIVCTSNISAYCAPFWHYLFNSYTTLCTVSN